MGAASKQDLIQLWKKTKLYMVDKLEGYVPKEQLIQEMDKYLADANFANVVPWSNVKANLIVDMTIEADSDGNLPQYVEISQRDDGTPLNLKAFVIQSDVKSSVSYTWIGFNDLSWIYSPPISHGISCATNTYIISKDGMYIDVHDKAGGFHPIGSIIQSTNPIPAIEQVDKIMLPKSASLSSGTFVKIWELTVEE